MNVKLSVLIPSVEERAPLLAALIEELVKQTDGKPVEILTWVDNKQTPIGGKRQGLLEKANGEWVVFIDDDDWITPDYIDSILLALEENPDTVGMEEEVNGHGTDTLKASWSNRWPHWAEGRVADKEGFDYLRTPNPKTPIRRSIALETGYNRGLRWNEDEDFSKRLKRSGLIKSEVYIPRVLYIYRYKYEPHNKKYGLR